MLAKHSNFSLNHYLEKYTDAEVLVAYYRGQKHWDWINGKNDRGTTIYNVRMDKDETREGD